MKKIIYICMLVGVLTSCNKFLDKKPSNEATAEDLFSTELGFQTALVDCYVRMGEQSLWGADLSYRSVEVMAQTWSYDNWNYKTYEELSTLDHTKEASRTIFESVYLALYNVVAQANNVLINLEKTGDVILDKDVRNIIKAEALTLRAYMHMEVYRLFGQMPISSPKTIVSLPYAEEVGIDANIVMYNNDDFLAKITSDLDAAEKLFEESDPAVDVLHGVNDDVTNTFFNLRSVRLNIHALRGLRARLALYVGDTTLAYQTAMAIINSTSSKTGKNIVTLSGKSDVDQEYYAMPSESLFNLGLRDFDGADVFKASAPGFYVINDVFTQIFGNDVTLDLRSKGVWNTDNVDYTGQPQPLLLKYVQNDEPSNNVMSEDTNIIPAIRLAEMYLIAIETAPTFTESKELFATYITSRDMPTKANDFTEITKEQLIEEQYRREFFAEGQLFFYYKRKFTKRMLFGLNVNDLQESNYVIPLPTSELGK